MEPRSAFSAPEDAVDNYDDVELLVRVSDRARDEADADAAFTIFFERHAEFLRRACERYRYCRPSFDAEDVVLRVMTEIYTGKAVFEAPADPDPEVVRKHLRRWLITVARNQFQSEVRKLHFDQNVVPMDAETGEGVTPPTYGDDDDSAPMPADRARILRFRERLKQVDQLIFDRSLLYYDRATQEFNVPPAVARAIAAEVGKKVPAVRKRRGRMMEALRADLAAD